MKIDFIQNTYLLAPYSQFPSGFDLLLDPQRADEIQAAELDEKVNGVYAFADGDMLRFRTPPLPRRRDMNAERASRSRYGRATPASVYAHGLCRVIDENRSILSPVARTMTRKNIYFLNLFAPQNHNAPDNDNRDIEKIINAICRFFPGRDTPETTRIILDGTASNELPEGTYITVNSYEKGLPNEAETIAFWKKKLCL